MVGKTKDFEAVLLQPLCSGLVVLCALLRTVLITIKLDNEPRFKTDKVSNVGTNGLLSAEFEARKLSAAQRSPQFAFNVRKFAP